MALKTTPKPSKIYVHTMKYTHSRRQRLDIKCPKFHMRLKFADLGTFAMTQFCKTDKMPLCTGMQRGPWPFTTCARFSQTVISCILAPHILGQNSGRSNPTQANTSYLFFTSLRALTCPRRHAAIIKKMTTRPTKKARSQNTTKDQNHRIVAPQFYLHSGLENGC